MVDAVPDQRYWNSNWRGPDFCRDETYNKAIYWQRPVPTRELEQINRVNESMSVEQYQRDKIELKATKADEKGEMDVEVKYLKRKK